ncbi:PLP-dependent cysteine synthase family protein [Leekyejoonella antrihumi]|uniref:L-cysteine desulfhydrase Cds1 n=1 Tax=Leekyejoonella antrihumi TaxID=1660198 RepID=A0A563DUG0_9MICO|nr:PLP-dependent cysteine synthase family protein [Leekyejoonella antrihumi]TWP33819.1 PLP-dependent cysteine synthase family protein [Leekyejoonella antrihumi]
MALHEKPVTASSGTDRSVESASAQDGTADVVDRCSAEDRAWLDEAIRKVEADANRSADTHLLPIPLPGDWGIDLYLKDESTHPTGSLKHRLARSLFLYALCSGRIHEDTTIIEASSGSTAVSEAYFARMLGLSFVAVIPKSTSPEKISLIEFYGGTCHFVAGADEAAPESRRLAAETGGYFMDQFTYAERATDWRSSNNIAESIFNQLAAERYPVPAWVVVGAGTGGTSATIGRYIRYRRHSTKLCVVDPENSAFFDGWVQDDMTHTTGMGSRIEGIGRPQVEPSFVPTIVDRMMRIPDAASVATVRYLEKLIGRRAGGSTGTSLWAALRIIAEMRSRGERGSVVALLCDGGERYCGTYYNDAWLRENGLDLAPYTAILNTFHETGEWPTSQG